jgi:hypothetical protein
MKNKDTKQTTHLSVNVTPDLVAELDSLVGRHRPFLRRHAAHRAALRVGIAELQRDPDRLVRVLTEERERWAALTQR